MFRRDSLCIRLHGVSNNGTIYGSIYGGPVDTLCAQDGSIMGVCI